MCSTICFENGGFQSSDLGTGAGELENLLLFQCARHFPVQRAPEIFRWQAFAQPLDFLVLLGDLGLQVFDFVLYAFDKSAVLARRRPPFLQFPLSRVQKFGLSLNGEGEPVDLLKAAKSELVVTLPLGSFPSPLRYYSFQTSHLVPSKIHMFLIKSTVDTECWVVHARILLRNYPAV